MVTVTYDENTKHHECEGCCQETTVKKMEIDEWNEKTDDWSFIWLCWYCTEAIKQCSFCAKSTLGTSPTWMLGDRHTRETVRILRATGKTVCEDCCEHVMAALTATYAAGVDTRPGHFQKSLGRPAKMSEEEYEDAWEQLVYEFSHNEWMIYEGQACDTLYDDLEDDFGRQPQWAAGFSASNYTNVVDEEEAYFEKYDRRQAKKPGKFGKGKKSAGGKKSTGGKKSVVGRVGKVCPTANPDTFKAIKDYAKKTVAGSEVIPETPRAALKRMDVPDNEFSALDMEISFRTVWALERPTAMTMSVPVPVSLLKRREPLHPDEFADLLSAVWKAYKGNIGRYLDWPDTHIRSFRKSNLIVDFVATPVEC